MAEIVKLHDKRNLSTLDNLNRIEELAKERFVKLTHFKEQEYANSIWQYRGEKLYFREGSNKPAYNTLIAQIIKSFVLSILWKNRLKTEQLSHTRIRELADVGRVLSRANLKSLSELSSQKYYDIWNSIVESGSNVESKINNLNSLIRYLDKEHVLHSQIDIVRAPQRLANSDESEQFKAIEARMPKPELIRGIIELKNKVEESFDNSDDSINDLLSVYTQAFQYGLGLRVGEVLRLSKDCLFEHEGKLLCRVWREKGAEPIPTYVLGDWRELILDVHTKIIEITKDIRSYASEIEETGTSSYVTNALKAYSEYRESNMDELVDELSTFLKQKKIEALKSWELKVKVKPAHEYELSELTDILPISSKAKNTPDKVKAYQKWGLSLKVTPIDSKKNSYTVMGQSILNFVDMQINLRSTHITEQEFLTILHGREVTRQQGRDKDIFDLVSELGGSTATCYTFNPQSFSGKGRAPTTMSKEQASNALKKYAYGFLDKDEISVADLHRFFPGIPWNTNHRDLQKANPDLVISGQKKIATRVDFASNPKSPVRYSITSGSAIKTGSISKFVLTRFFESNHAIINQLNDVEKEEQLGMLRESETNGQELKLLSTDISSQSFKVKQQISDYLFIRAMKISASKRSLRYIPEVLSYHALSYFFKGNDRYPSAFHRFNVNGADNLYGVWQSHQGRHWRNTSLFRSGAQKSLVNKLMGRKNDQGKHYDHNSGIERAKIIGQAMDKQPARFLGKLPSQIGLLKQRGAEQQVIDDVLSNKLQTVSYTPQGMCTQSLELNPCQYHLRCLIGNDGSGCKYLIIDLEDPTSIPVIKDLKDKTEHEITRLVKLKDETGNIAIDQHLKHQIKVYDNAKTVVELAERLTHTGKSDLDLLPFEKDGSYPDDCPFQCGGD